MVILLDLVPCSSLNSVCLLHVFWSFEWRGRGGTGSHVNLLASEAGWPSLVRCVTASRVYLRGPFLWRFPAVQVITCPRPPALLGLRLCALLRPESVLKVCCAPFMWLRHLTLVACETLCCQYYNFPEVLSHCRLSSSKDGLTVLPVALWLSSSWFWAFSGLLPSIAFFAPENAFICLILSLSFTNSWDLSLPVSSKYSFDLKITLCTLMFKVLLKMWEGTGGGDPDWPCRWSAVPDLGLVSSCPTVGVVNL